MNLGSYMAPPRDAMGRRVLPGLAAPFRARVRIAAAVANLKQWEYEMRRIHACEDVMQDIPMQDVYDAVEKACTTLMDGSPAVPCECPPDEVDCPLCMNRKWLSANDIARIAASEAS